MSRVIRDQVLPAPMNLDGVTDTTYVNCRFAIVIDPEDRASRRARRQQAARDHVRSVTRRVAPITAKQYAHLLKAREWAAKTEAGRG